MMPIFSHIKFGSRSLHSGQTSNVFFDVIGMMTEPNVRWQILEHLRSQLPTSVHDVTDTLIGIELGGALLASALAEISTPSCEWMGISKYKLGFYRKDGELVLPEKVSKAILIDDVITTGASIEEATKALKGAGISITRTLCIVDRRKL